MGRRKELTPTQIAVQAAAKHRRGGWRGNPNSLAALAKHRPRAPNYLGARCSKTGCKSPAVKSADYCQKHGGHRQVLVKNPTGAAARKYVRTAKFARNQEITALYKLLASIPANIKLDVVRYLQKHGVGRRVPNDLFVALVLGWREFLEHDQAGPWLAAVQRAKQAGYIG